MVALSAIAGAYRWQSAAGSESFGTLILSTFLPIAIQTALFAGLAIVCVRGSGFGMRSATGATAKFVAALLMAVAVANWVDSMMGHAGALPHKLQGSIHVWIISVIMSAIIILGLAHYFFDSHEQQVGWGVLASLIAWGIGGSIWFFGFIICEAIVSAPRAAPAAAPPSTPPPPPATATAATSTAIASSTLDQEIAQRIARIGSPLIRDARDWKMDMMADRATKKLIDDLFAAGAPRINVEMTVHNSDHQLGARLYVELPASPTARPACAKVFQDYASQHPVGPDSVTLPAAKRFMVIETTLSRPGR
jgi:hypothetical protein